MATITSENLQATLPIDPEIEAMMEAGVHLGHARSKHNPGMIPYLWGVRNNVEIIDLTKTKEKLAEALAFLKQAAEGRKLLLFVGTRPSAKDLVRSVAEELGYPSVTERWVGGTLTNFRIIRQRIETLEALEQEKASGGFEKYTKKERLVKDEEIMRLRQHFDGLRRLTKLPDALFIIDISHDDLALHEARRIGIPVVALTDTNTDPRAVQYPIPANDDARSAITYIVERVKASIVEGQQAAASAEYKAAAGAGKADEPAAPNA